MKKTPLFNVGDSIFILDMYSYEPIQEKFIVSIKITRNKILYEVGDDRFNETKIIEEYYVGETKEKCIEKLNNMVEMAKKDIK